MNITKENNEVVIRIPLIQRGESTYGEGQWSVPNLVGVIEQGKNGGDDEYSLWFAQYLDYKDSLQTTSPAFHFYGDREEFVALCEELLLEVEMHTRCVECQELIYGTHTLTDKGVVCLECNSSPPSPPLS